MGGCMLCTMTSSTNLTLSSIPGSFHVKKANLTLTLTITLTLTGTLNLTLSLTLTLTTSKPTPIASAIFEVLFAKISAHTDTNRICVLLLVTTSNCHI